MVEVLYVGFNEKFALHDFAVYDCDKCLNKVVPYLNKVCTFYLVFRFDVTFSDITVALHLVACVKGGL